MSFDVINVYKCGHTSRSTTWGGPGQGQPIVDDFRFLFAYTLPVFNTPDPRFRDFVVRCKGCSESIPAPVQTMPDTWIITQCPLCGERRAYLPTDIFRGRLSYKLTLRKTTRSGTQPWAK